MQFNAFSSFSRLVGLARHWQVSVVLLLSLIATLAAYAVYQWQEHLTIATRARLDASDYSRTLWHGTKFYTHLNRDVAGLFAASDNVTPREFEDYIRRIQAFETHPGLSYIGFVPRVATSQIAQFEVETRKTFPSYAIHSNHWDSDTVYPLLYTVPFDEKARRFIGFDYAMIPERREAMQKAADLGESVATRKSAGLLAPLAKNYIFIFTPVYDAAKPITTLMQRRDALSGFVFSVLLMEDVIESVMGPKFKRQFDLEVYDGKLGREEVIYDGDSQPHALEDSVPLAAYTETIDFARTQWILHLQPKSFSINRYASSYGWLILLSGSLASILLSWLAWRWQHQRHAQLQQASYAQRFLAVFKHHPSAVFSLDTQWRVINANPQARQQFDTSRTKLLGASLLEMIANEDASRVLALLTETLTGASVSYDTTLATDTDKRIEVSIVLIPVTIGGKVSSVLGIAENITERRQSEWKLQEAQQMLQLVVDNIPQRVFWKDTELYYLGCNNAFCEDAGIEDPKQIVGKTDSDFPWKEEAEAYRQDDLRTMQCGVPKINYEEPQHRKDGSLNWLRTSKVPLTNGQGHKVGVLGMYEDITERKQMEQRLEHMALYDSLTGLPNRAHFYARLEQAVGKAERHNMLIGLMYFDIDKFKRINDTYGHDVGDKVIGMFAVRVKGAIRESDVIGRLGGDEFCILLENLPNRQAAQKLAAKLIDAMQPVMQIGETELPIVTSIGIAFYEPGMTADEMMRCADQAMYNAKQSGGNQVKLAQNDAQLV